MKFKSNYFLTWILEEVKEQQAGININPVTIICKDGERITTSSMLLTAISPYLGPIFDYVDNEELVILLPDVESVILSNFLDWILAKKNHTDRSFLSDKNIFSALDGVFWTIEKSRVIFPLKSADPGILDTFLTIIKCEEDVADEDFKLSASRDSPIQTTEFENLENRPIDIVETISLSKEDNKTKSKKKRVNKRSSRKNDKENVDDGSGAIKKNIKPDVDNIEDEKPRKRSLTKPDQSRIVAKKSKLKEEGDILEAKPVDDDLNDESFEPDGSNGDQTDSEQDSENDYQENSQTKKAKSSKTTDIKRVKDQGRKGKKKNRRVFVNIADLPQNEEYQIGQAKLKAALEDPSVLTDPRQLWYEYHNHPANMKFSVVKPKLICPKCSLNCPINSKGQVFFNHLRSHKIRNYSCPCRPKGGSFPALKLHIESTHWNWEKCQVCPDFVDPEKMAGHMLRKHNQYNKDTVCPDCGATYGSLNFKDFRMHMEYHKADKFTCDCQIVFENRKQKLHHMQVEHLKELFGCDKCHTVCITQDDLDQHIKLKHTDKGPKQFPICDICGYVCKGDKPWLLRWHKERMHDPVLLDCTICSAKMNASALKDHMKHHANAGVCQECGAQVQNVKRHMKARHRPTELMKYQCEFCTKAFQYSRDIKRHMMSAHLKERPYKCRYGCEFAYNDSSNRNQHEKKKHGQIFTAKSLETVKDEVPALNA